MDYTIYYHLVRYIGLSMVSTSLYRYFIVDDG